MGGKPSKGRAMPRAPKQCGREGCETRGTGRYCLAHQSQWDPKRTHAKSGEHKTWRRAVLERDRGHCQINGPHCTGRATQAAHIVAVAFGGDPYDVNNGQAACPTCHKAKSLAEATEGRRRNALA